MNETTVLYIGYTPGDRFYTPGGLEKTSQENYCRLIAIFRSSQFNLKGLPMPSKEVISRRGRRRSFGPMIQKASKPFEQEFGPYMSLLDRDKARFLNISHLERFIKRPQNKEKEPQIFKFCIDYLAFKKQKWEICMAPAMEDLKNFIYMLESIYNQEIQAKVYKEEEILKPTKTQQKKSKKVRKGKGKRIEKVKCGTTVLHSSQVSENNRDGQSNASFDESSQVTRPDIGEECEDCSSAVETNFKPEEHSAIECFPDNILLNIFSKADVASVNAVKATCRRFNTVAQDHEVWRGVFAEEFDVDPKVMKSQPDNGTWEEVCQSLHAKQKFNKKKNKGNGRCEGIVEDIRELTVKDTVEDTVEDKPEMEVHCFVFYLPNVMHRPNPRAYTALSRFLATIRNNTLQNLEEYKLERFDEDNPDVAGWMHTNHFSALLYPCIHLDQRTHFFCNGL